MKIFLLSILVLTNYAFAQTDVENKMSEFFELKIETELTLNSIPFRNAEQDKIKQYFVSLQNYSFKLKEDTKLNKRFNSYLGKIDLPLFCSNLLIDKRVWESIVENCTRNRFFLCADEVKEYSAIKLRLANSLNQELFEKFNNTQECSNINPKR